MKKGINRERLKTGAIVVLGLLVMLLLLSNWDLRAREDFETENADQQFRYYFSTLFDTSEDADDQRMNSRVSRELFRYTSYGENETLSDVVVQICQWGEKGELGSHLDRALAEKLRRLCYELSSYGKYPLSRDRDKATEALMGEIAALLSA